MPTSKSYTVSIVVNGHRLTEYDPPKIERSDDSRKCVRYIEASEGSEFRVHLDLAPQTKFHFPNKHVHIYIDGKHAAGFVLTKQRARETPYHEYATRVREENGRFVEQAFLFKRIVTTDETPKTEELRKIAHEIGKIRVEIHSATEGERVPFQASRAKESSEVVPEKALKGQPIYITAGYGEKKTAQSPHQTSSHMVGPAEASFEFKYRSRRALQLLDLIPATPEAQALEERDPNTLNLDEARMLLSQYRQREPPAPRVKSEGIKKEEFNVKVEGEETENKSRKRPASFIDDDELQVVDVKRCKPITIDEVDVLDLS